MCPSYQSFKSVFQHGGGAAAAGAAQTASAAQATTSARTRCLRPELKNALALTFTKSSGRV
jgi:hypothetical protein